MKTTPAPVLRGVTHWRGVPVPFVAAWTSEHTLTIRTDPLLGGRPALFRSGSRGDGKPIFGKMDEARTRAVVLRELCQVCAKPLKGDGWVCDVPIAHTSRGAPILHEPPCCGRCFRAARMACPGMARLLERRGVIVARVRRSEPMMVPVRAAPGGSDDLNALLATWDGAPPIGYVRAALLEWDTAVAAGVRAEAPAITTRAPEIFARIAPRAPPAATAEVPDGSDTSGPGRDPEHPNDATPAAYPTRILNENRALREDTRDSGNPC